MGSSDSHVANKTGNCHFRWSKVTQLLACLHIAPPSLAGVASTVIREFKLRPWNLRTGAGHAVKPSGRVL